MVLCFIGLILSIYAYRVTVNLKRMPQYKPLCDISNRVSCKRAFNAKESHLFIVPNSLWGMVYYFVAIMFIEYNWLLWAFYLSTIGLIVSLYLSFILYYRHKNFCVICWAIHLVNLFIFVSLLFSTYLS